MILKINENADFNAMPEILKRAIKEGDISWPENKMIGTKAVDGKKLILISTSLRKDELESWLIGFYPVADDEGDVSFIDFGLDWEIVACEGEIIDQDLIIPFINELPVYDENGEVDYFEEVFDITDKLQTIGSRVWTYA